MRPASRPHLVLVGGGHAHVRVLRAFAEDPPPARLTVVVDRPVAVYSGMVPGFVAGQYAKEDLEIDVAPLAAAAGAEMVVSACEGVDAEARRLELADGSSVGYDLASFDIGSTVMGLDLPGVREHALPTRPIGTFVERIGEVERAARERPPSLPFRVVVVGGGAGGLEVAFTLRQRLLDAGVSVLRVTIVHGGDEILSGYEGGIVRRLRRAAAERGIQILAGTKVTAAGDEALELDAGSPLPYDALLWVTGATAHGVLRRSGLPVEERGFAWIRPTLQVRDHDELFAAGDCATLEEHPRTPKAGVYAVRQGPVLEENLRRALDGRELREYEPQSEFLTLLNLGDGTAAGVKWGISFEGRWVMRLKDWIDRRFVGRFRPENLPS